MSDGPGWPFGTSGMASRIRGFDWTATPLGPCEEWPLALKVAVQLMLAQVGPTLLCVGPGWTQLYNDDHAALLGPNHPAALGRDARAGIADPGLIAALTRVFAGETLFRSGQPHALAAAGAPAGWFDLSATPVPDETGRILAIMLRHTDVTSRVEAEAERRRAAARESFLLRLSDALRPLDDPVTIEGKACALLAERLDVDRADYVEVDEAAGTARVGRDFVRGGAPSLAGEHRVADFAWSVENLRRDRHVVEDTQNAPVVPEAARPASAALGIIACAGAPLIKGGRLAGALCVTLARPHAWTDDEVGLLRDVGERIWAAIERARAEAALRESEARFRGFADNSGDVMWIVDGAGQRVVYLSPAFERLFGAPREAALGDIRMVRGLVHPDDRAAFDAAMPRARAGEAVMVQYRVPDAAAGRCRHLRDTGFPIRTEDGAIRYIGGIVQDLSDMEEARRALEAEKDRFRSLAEGIPQLVWRASAQGDWTWASPQWCDFTGQTLDASLGRGWLDALHPDDRAATLAAWAAAGPSGRLAVEYRVRRAADGAWRWHQTGASPLRDAAEWLGTSTDIDELKRLQAEQAVLLAELQHRTRNLITVTRSIARRSFGPSPERDTYDGRLAAMGRVQGFLARSGAWSVPLRDLVAAELEAAGDGAAARVTMEGPAVRLPGEKAQALALALHELATNAAKYGALAQPEAGLSVVWRIAAGGRLVLDWRESGVALSTAGSARRGYGSELLDRALPYQLGAETRREFGPDGVRCSITLPPGAFVATGGPA